MLGNRGAWLGEIGKSLKWVIPSGSWYLLGKIVISWDLTIINGDLMVIYPLVNIQKAMENGHRNSGFTQL